MAGSLIKPKVHVTRPKPDQLKRISQAVKAADGSYVQVGWFDQTKYPDGTLVSQVAIWNEYGTKKAKNHAATPARPFMRPAMDNNREDLEATRAAAIQMAVFRAIPVSQALGTIGLRAQEHIRNAIKANPGPALAARTMARKVAHGKPRVSLIDTRVMLDNLSMKVVLNKKTLEHEDQVRENQEKSAANRKKKYEAGAAARARARSEALEQKKANAERRKAKRQADRGRAKVAKAKAKVNAKAARAKAKSNAKRAKSKARASAKQARARAKAIKQLKGKVSNGLNRVAKAFGLKKSKSSKPKKGGPA